METSESSAKAKEVSVVRKSEERASVVSAGHRSSKQALPRINNAQGIEKKSEEEVQEAKEQETETTFHHEEVKKIPELASRSRPIQAIADTFPRITKAAMAALKFWILRDSRFSIERQPYEHFSNQQVMLAAASSMKRIRSELITVLEIRDHFSNLYAFHLLTAHRQSEFTVFLGDLIKQYIIILGDITTCLEIYCKMPPVDYLKIIEAINNTSAPFIDLPSSSDYSLIPEVSDLQTVRLLGAGGFGAVYKAIIKPAEVVCSVKVVPSAKHSKTQSACMDKVAASVMSNQNVVRYMCCFSTEQAYVTIMEYVRGVDLLNVMDKCKTFTVRQCRLIMAQMFLGIEHMHFRGLIHRDIKVSNCLIMINGVTKLIDFDTSKTCSGHFPRRRLISFFKTTCFEFKDQESAGTLTYMAPEVLMLKGYGRAVDWWSVGVTLFKMLTGKTPFRGNDNRDVKNSIIQSNIEFPKSNFLASSVCNDIKSIIVSLCKKNSNQRLGSRNYKDIIRHRFLSSVSWDDLRRSQNNTVVLNMPEVTQAMGGSKDPTLDNECLSPEASLATKSKSMLRIEELDNLPSSKQTPLFTFVHAAFKKLQEKLKTDEPPKQVGENLFDIIEPKGEEPGSSSIFTTSAKHPYEFQEHTSTKGLSRQYAEKIDILIFPEKSDFGVETEICEGEDKQKYHVLRNCAEGSSHRSQLMTCDIIIEVNNKSVIDATMEEFQKLLNKNPRLAVVSVLASNPFRISKTRPLLRKYCVMAREINLYISKVNDDIGFGFVTQMEQAYDQKKKKSYKYHLVRVRSRQLKITPEDETLFTGDLVMRVSGKAAGKLNQSAMKKLLNSKESTGKPLKLKIAGISALRKDRPQFSRLTEIESNTTSSATTDLSATTLSIKSADYSGESVDVVQQEPAKE